MPDGKLTTKQQLFVEAYLGPANGNATEAARMAGYKGNDKTLEAMGRQNLALPRIASRVQERLNDAAMVANHVLGELAKVARLPFDGDPKSVQNKVRALELLGKHHKLFVDSQEVKHSGTIGGITPTINVFASESK